MLALGLIAAVAAAAGNAGAALMEAMATRRAVRAAGVVLSPMYLGGLLLDLLAWGLTVVALRYLPIVAVQAVVAGQVVITVVASHRVFDTPLRRVDLAAALANVLGLGLLVATAETGDPRPVGPAGALVLGAVFAALVVAGAVGALRRAGAIPMAVLAGLGFGGTAVAVRLIHVHGPLGAAARQLLTDPVAWLLLGYGALALTLYTVALARGAVGPVVAVLAVTETVAPGALGLLLLGDGIRAGWVPGFLLGLALALGGVVVLARSPAQASLSGEDGAARPPLKRW